jgi:ribosomal protein L40E
MDPKLVTLCTYQFAFQAEMARWSLEQAGIQSFVSEANTVTADWFLGPALGWIKLEVAETDAPAALAIFEQDPKLSKPIPNYQEEVTPMTACLRCGAAMSEASDTCQECGWSYLNEEMS